MANRRSIAREIAPHVGMEPRAVEKVLATYFTALAAATKLGAGVGSLGLIRPTLRSVRLERPGGEGGETQVRVERRTVPRFIPSRGLRRAAEEGTLPPGVRRLLSR